MEQGQFDQINAQQDKLKKALETLDLVSERLNTSVETLNAAIEKLQEEKEEEEEPEEEISAKLEERFKLNEEFMHKESVKVYRNVQAILNEKSEKQSDSSDLLKKELKKVVGGVKGIALFTLILTLIDLTVLVLHIFGII